MDDWVRSLHQAREVLAENPDRMPVKLGPVRPIVYESWRRSRLQGLDPERLRPAYYEDIETDSYLTRVVTPLVEKRRAVLDQSSCALSVTDHEGRLLRRWAPDASFASRLDSLDVVPRFSFAEGHVGTTSVISLLKGAPVLVRGPEHFPQMFHSLSCAGAPIVHPVTRRTIGSLDLTCRLSDTSPVMLAWVMEMVAEIQDALRESASRRERLLLDAYLTHNRDARHPLVTLDHNTIITNAAAARLLGAVDQALLWEHASRAMSEHRSGPAALTLANGRSVTIETRPVSNGPDTVGAVLQIKEAPARPASKSRGPASAPAARLPGLVGRSPHWMALCEQATRLPTRERILIVGEAGSGRRAVAAALAAPSPVRIVDAADVWSRGIDQWLQDVESEVGGPDETLVLAHINLLEPRVAQATDRALGRRAGGGRVLATSEAGPVTAAPSNSLLGTFSHVLHVPALRDRMDDLPLLITTLAERVAGQGPVLRWMPDAIQVLSRLEWSGNVASLEALVRQLHSRCRSGYVGAAELPADVVALASRRPLARLEQAEAHAIMQALRAAKGNKHRAAESLGIARSTLYRKVRALGLDLSTTAY
ncbi:MULTISPECIES: sigma-54-dependent Fis family transcriptional regulator [Amycolatopsis]|uniref:sigma-54-dependent Fis family transcriptional regulator n=1 Tax=Amycolatopsis TaxID=1813 RepID=UPI001178188E|nr:MULTISPECIES: helix-turn-helix domain-containing protein [Amycolatopsis]